MKVCILYDISEQVIALQSLGIRAKWQSEVKKPATALPNVVPFENSWLKNALLCKITNDKLYG